MSIKNKKVSELLKIQKTPSLFVFGDVRDEDDKDNHLLKRRNSTFSKSKGSGWDV